MKWTVGTRVGAGVALALAADGTVSYRGLSEITEATDLRAHRYLILEEVKDLLIRVTSAEAEQRNYIITGEVSYRDGFDAATAATREKLASLNTLTKEDTRQQERVRQLNVAVGVNHRSDKVGSLARAFGEMAQRLSSLIGQAQKSGIQVTTSGTEIAATAKQQLTEIAAALQSGVSRFKVEA